jgi:hypothetical protein
MRRRNIRVIRRLSDARSGACGWIDRRVRRFVSRLTFCQRQATFLVETGSDSFFLSGKTSCWICRRNRKARVCFCRALWFDGAPVHCPQAVVMLMRSCAVLSIALALTILVAPDARGQATAASVTVGGQVSGAVFVSIAPGAQLSGETLPAVVTHSNLDRHTVRLSISTSGSGGSRRITIPLQLRSNVGYTLHASATLNGTTRLRGLCVANVRATGRHVARAATNAANMAACVDGAANVQIGNANRSGFASPTSLLQGQFISLSGTPDSPFNALEVLILVEVEPQTRQPQGSIELILSATPNAKRS